MTATISAALVKAQREFAPALKTSTNPHFRSKYADLSACVEAVVDALNNNGIMLMQQSHECSNGVLVETVFIHESGETISAGKLHVPASKSDAQGFGSALTYARRYSLMAACGIAPEDDDGNAASKSNKPAPMPQKVKDLVAEIKDTKPKVSAKEMPEDALEKQFNASKPKPADEETIRKLVKAFFDIGIDMDALEAKIGKSIDDLTDADIVKVKAIYKTDKEAFLASQATGEDI